MNRRVVSGFSLSVVLLVMIGWISYQSIIEFRATAEMVSQSHYLTDKRQDLLTSIMSAESEARGYVIMGRKEYLSLYEKAIADVNRGVAVLRTLQSQSASPELVGKLTSLIELRLERLRITIEARQLEGLDAVVGVAGVGKQLMDEVRSVAADIEAVEDQRLRSAASRLSEVSQRATWIIGMGSVLAVLFHLISTVALGRAVANRERLERSLLEISEREQRRIGQDLHDGLCQQLTGISLMVSSLHRCLIPGAERELSQVANLINGCIEETRLVTRGLHPVPDEPGGLIIGLRELVDSVHSNSGVSCELSIEGPLQIPDPTVSSNVYRIAQEAVRNALKHSGARHIRLTLKADGRTLDLRVEDDGSGLPQSRPNGGLGLSIMKYRASTIGGHLNILPTEPSGTLVYLQLPLKRGAPPTLPTQS